MPDFTPRPTTYRGVKMRSRLEAGYAAWLDRWNIRWEYEPQAFASPQGQYLPDFKLSDVPRFSGGTTSLTTVYVEVKPEPWTGDLDALARRMAIIEESVPGPVELLLERPNTVPRLVFITTAGTVHWLPMHWAYDVGRGPDYPELLTLVDSVERVLQPWPDGYWNGPR